MENPAAYARVRAFLWVKECQQEPIFGKPYLRLGQCLAMWAHFFQMGSILSMRHLNKLDAFGPAFLGIQGEPGEVKRRLGEVAKDIVSPWVNDSTTYFDYVVADSMMRMDHSGDTVSFLQKSLGEKIGSETAADVAWQYARDGAALGAIDLRSAFGMFERSHAAVPEDRWQRARDAGLDIPQEQDLLTYDEVEEEEEELFMAFCEEFFSSML